MTTLPLMDPDASTGEVRRVLELVARRNGRPLSQVSAIYLSMAYWPQYAEANEEHSRATFKQSGSFDKLTRQCMHIAVSTANNCRY